MQDIIKFEIIEMVKDINKNDPSYICQQTETLLYHIFKDIITSEEVENISVIYRLIFHSFKQNPIIAYQILSGFLQFGQSSEGRKCKPLLDHLAIETFDKLIALGGWSILKDCVNTLRDNLDNIDAEPIFLHIISSIVKQLSADEHEPENPDNISDICHYLPREKSFVWGWFSYYIALAYYSAPLPVNKNKMRNCLMKYRKLLNNLRQIVPSDDPSIIQINEISHIIPTWDDILLSLNEENKWASEFIKNLLLTSENKPDSTCISTCMPPDSACMSPDSTCQTVVVDEIALAIACADDLDELIERAIVKLDADTNGMGANAIDTNGMGANGIDANAMGTNGIDTNATEPTITPSSKLPVEEKNNNASWFSWLGWS
jgi:hypothetical protein